MLASPMIVHDSTCALNTPMFHLMAVVVSAAVTVVDVTLGLLMLGASAIMIGTFNYDHAMRAAGNAAPPALPDAGGVETAAPAPPAPPSRPKSVPVSEVNPEPRRDSTAHPPPAYDDAGGAADDALQSIDPGLVDPPVRAPSGIGKGGDCDAYSLGARESYQPLDFLRSRELNPNGFVTEESLRKVQTNMVSPDSLGNVYSPLGRAVYTAQGILPGSDLRGAA
eukprot:jgi/Tetstr1/447328/TSEL_034765.t1